MKIEIHSLTNNPTAAWADVSKCQKVLKIHAKPPKAQVAANKVSNTQNLILSYTFDSSIVIGFLAFGALPHNFFIWYFGLI